MTYYFKGVKVKTCKDCKFYKANTVEECINKKEAWIYRTESPRYDITKQRSFGTCEEVVIDTCDMSSENMEKQSCKIMTWDGSAYMSGAYVSEDFGCIKFEAKGSK